MPGENTQINKLVNPLVHRPKRPEKCKNWPNICSWYMGRSLLLSVNRWVTHGLGVREIWQGSPLHMECALNLLCQKCSSCYLRTIHDLVIVDNSRWKSSSTSRHLFKLSVVLLPTSGVVLSDFKWQTWFPIQLFSICIQFKCLPAIPCPLSLMFFIFFFFFRLCSERSQKLQVSAGWVHQQQE